VILAEDNLSPDQREYLDIYEQSGYKMLNIINLSLGMLKMEQGVYALSATLVELVRVIRKVGEELGACGRLATWAWRSSATASRPVPQLPFRSSARSCCAIPCFPICSKTPSSIPRQVVR
jgi:hypothetical protein